MPPLPSVRSLLLVLALSACAGPVRPAVMHNMETLPTDPQRRSEQLDSAQATPSADSRKSLSPGEKTAETAAATAAAFIGSLFSSKVPGSDSPAILFGAASPAEEMPLVDPTYEQRKKKAEKDAARAEEGDEPPPGDGQPLVPWIKIRAEDSP